MRVRLTIGWLILFTLVAAIGYAQNPPASNPLAPAPAPMAAPQLPVRTLALAEALQIARENNPDYLSVLNDRWSVSARQRAALLNLVTPTASISAGSQRTNAGTTFFSTTAFPSPANTYDSWSLSLNYQLSGTTISNRSLANADARATDADISGGLIVLETNIRSQYLNLLQAFAQRKLAERSLDRTAENLSLAQARMAVGQGTLIDVRRAEVDRDQAQVNVLTARQTVDNQTLLLFQYMGVPAPDNTEVVPSDSFPVTQPLFTLDSLIRDADRVNPSLVSARARESSARWNTRSMVSQYLPTLQVNGRLGGYRQVNDAYVQSVTDSLGNKINIPVAANTTTSANPFSLYVGLSMPIYDGLSRASQIQQARSLQDDAHQLVRSRELLLRSQVVAAFNALNVAYQTIALRRAGQAAASEALDLATQRYRVGSGTYLELLDARNAADLADANYVGSVYDYHKAIATLENAVGRPLR
ncbi:MAG TPA: TolC family protein [Gemmatimonadales bacterium]|jgi:outer membrane protein